MVMVVNVPTVQRSNYFAGMTTEFFEQAELPPAKGLWSLNTDRILKVTCQMEQTGSYTPQDELEFDEEDQNNVHVDQQGVILDEHGNYDLVQAMSSISVRPQNEEESEDDELPELEEAENEAYEQSLRPEEAVSMKWADESITSTVRPCFVETEPSMAIDPLNFRKRSHFNGRPFACWGNLCSPLFGTAIFPLPPMTQKFWWQMARDALPAEKNSAGTPENGMIGLVRDYMKPIFQQQQWEEDIMEGIAYCKMSSMDSEQCRTVMKVFIKNSKLMSYI